MSKASEAAALGGLTAEHVFGSMKYIKSGRSTLEQALKDIEKILEKMERRRNRQEALKRIRDLHGGVTASA